MSSLKDQIAKDVQEIKEDNKKHFGTKLPGNSNKEQEQTEQELTYSQMIMGSLASLVWGVKYVKDENKVKALLGKNSLYDLVNDIKTTITEFKNVIDNTVIKTQVTNLEILKNPIDTLNTTLIKLNDTLSSDSSKVTASDLKMLEDNINVSIQNELKAKLKKLTITPDAIIIDDTSNLYASKLAEKIKSAIEKQSIIKLDKITISPDKFVLDTTKLDASKLVNQIKEALTEFNEIDFDSYLLGINAYIDLLSNKDYKLFDKNIENNITLLNSLFDVIKNLELEKEKLIYIDIQYKGIEERINELKKIIINTLYDPNVINEIKEDIDKKIGQPIKINIDDLTKLDELLKTLDKKVDIFDKSNLDQASELIKILKDKEVKLFDSNIVDKLRKDVEKKFDKDHPVKISFEIDNDAETKINEIISALSNLNFNIDDEITTKINDLVSAISKLDFKDSFNGIESLRELLYSLESKVTYDPDAIKKNIEEITKIIESSKNELGNLFKSISDIISSDNIKSINKDLRGLNATLQTIITVISIDPKTINLKGLRTLLSISDPDRGPIKKLFDNLIVLTNRDDKATPNNKAIMALGDFFEAVAKLGDIGLIKRYKITSNLKYFSKFISKEMPTIFKELTTVAGKAKSGEKLKAMAALGDFFLGLIKIAEIDRKKRRKLRSNLTYIRKYILGSLVGQGGIITEIVKAINKVSPDFEKSIKNLNDIFDKLFKAAEFSFKDLILLDLKLSYLSSIVSSQFNNDKDGLIKTLNGMNSKSLEAAQRRVELFEELFEYLNSMFNNIIPLKTLLSTSIKLKVMDSVDLKLMAAVVKHINELPDINGDKVQSIIDNINKISIDNKLFEKVDNVVKLIKALDSLDKSVITSKLSMAGLSTFEKIVKKLKSIIDSYKDIDEKKLKEALEINKQFTKLIVVSAAVLLAGAIIMNKIKISNLIAFTVALSFFLVAVSFTYSIMKKAINNSFEVAESFMQLIAVSALILVAGSLITRYIRFKDLLAFTLMLSGFILAVAGTYIIMSAAIKKAISIGEDFEKLIIISATSLIAGALFVKLIGAAPVLLFGLILAGFVATITVTFALAGGFLKSALRAAKSLAILVGITTISLMIGALFVLDSRRVAGALLFGVILEAFIYLIVKSFNTYNPLIIFSLHAAGALALLIGVSALSLILGALIVSSPKTILGAIVFALTLELFIKAITKAFISKDGEKIIASIPVAIALGIVTFISGMTLLLGGGLLAAFPELILTVPLFGTILWGFTAMMCKTLRHASKYTKDILMGAKIMAILGGLVAEMSITFMLLIKASKMIDDWPALLGTITVMGLTLWGLIGLIHLITPIAGEVVLATIVLAGLIGCIALIGIAVQEIAKGMEDMARVSHMDLDFGNLIKLLIGFTTLTSPMMALGALAVPISFGAIGMRMLRSFLLNAVDIIQAYASLNIPIYDENGKEIGRRNLSQADISNAMNNTKAIVTSLFDTIKEIYNSNKELFGFDLASALLGTGGTIFGKVAAAGKGLAVMLSMLADSIKEWADLKIPIYDNKGKKIGYKTIDNTAFVKAGQNIQAVITCLGQSIIDVYKNAPDGMFNYQFGIFGDSPFEKVSKSLLQMGKMLAVVGDAIENWADLKIPIYKGTEVQGYITLDNDAFIKAGENIKAVVKCLAGAVLDVYDENPEMFVVDWLGLGSSKFSKVSGALSNLGQGLGSIAKGIEEWSDLKIPIYKGTEVDHYLSLTDKEFNDAAKNIKKVILCLSSAIMDVYDENEDMFDDSWFTDSPFSKVIDTMKPMGKALKNIGEAVKDWAELKIPIYKENSAEISGYIKLTDSEFKKVGENIDSVVTCLFESIGNLYDKHQGKGWFDNDIPGYFDIFSKGETPIAKVLGTIGPLGNTLKDIASAVKDWSELKIPIYGQDEKSKAIVSGYVTLSSEMFNKAMENIKDVIITMIISVASLATGDTAQYFERDKALGIFEYGDSPLSKVLGTIGPLGNALKDIAIAVKNWAELKIPVYSSNQQTGEAIISDYITLDKDTFKSAGEHVKDVVIALVDAVGKLGTDDKYKKYFERDKALGIFEYGDSPLSKVLGTIGPLGNIIAGIAEGVKLFADFKIPIYDKSKTGEAIISDYITLSKGDIKDAADHIGEIITAIVKSVGNLYYLEEAQQGHWFDRQYWNSPNSDSPIGKVLSSIEPLGNIIAGIAEGIKLFADFKIPVYGKNAKGELVVKDYITLGNENEVMNNVGKNMGIVITSLGNAIAKVVKDNPGIFDKENNPTQVAAEAIKLTSDTLTGIASVIASYATGVFPILKYDKNGKLIPNATITINDAQIASMQDRVNKVITALGNAIIAVYNKPANKEIFDQFDNNGFKKDAPIMIVASSIKALSESLTTTIDVITKISELDFNTVANNLQSETGLANSFERAISSILSIYAFMTNDTFSFRDADGKFHSITYKDGLGAWLLLSKKSVIDGAQAISTLKDKLIEIFKSIKEIDESYNANKIAIDSIIKSNIHQDFYILINCRISNILASLMILGELIDAKKEVKSARQLMTSITSALGEIFEGIVSINNLYTDEKNNAALTSLLKDDEFIKLLNKIINKEDSKGLLNSIINNIAIEYDNNILRSIISNNKIILSDLIDHLDTIFNSISNLHEMFNKFNTDDINKFMTPVDSDYEINIKVKTIKNIIEGLYNTLSQDIDYKIIDTSKYKSIINNVANLLNDIQVLRDYDSKVYGISFENIEIAINKFALFINNIKKSLSGDAQDISDAISIIGVKTSKFDVNIDFEETIRDAENVYKLINKILNLVKFSTDIDGNSYEMISTGIGNIYTALLSIKVENEEDINKFITDLKGIINLIQDTIDFDIDANTLRDGILNIYNITKEIESKEGFKNHTSDLQKYIEAINSIDLGRINSLTSLVDAMNQLSQHLGNIDNLTDALSNRLSAVLLELVNQLRMADASIKNAHKLQERRKQLIDESIEKVKTIMDAPMKVEISQKTDDYDTTKYPSGIIDDNPVTNDENVGDDTEQNTTVIKTENPESAINKKFTTPAKSELSNVDLLTEQRFIQLMKENLKDWSNV